jgi:hypothetical protein
MERPRNEINHRQTQSATHPLKSPINQPLNNIKSLDLSQTWMKSNKQIGRPVFVHGDGFRHKRTVPDEGRV